MKKDYVSEVMGSTRILSHGKVLSLTQGFSLPNKQAFSIFAVPKQGSEISGNTIILSVRLNQDEEASDVPVLLNEWSTLAIEEIAANQNDVLSQVDIYWGSGNYIENGVCKVTTAPTAKQGLVYSGEAQALVNAGVGTGVVQYKLDDGEFSANIPTATNVGVYQVSYKVVDPNGLNEESDVQNLRCAIAEKFVNNPTIELTPSSFTYNGSACVPEVVVKDGDRVIPSNEYTVEITNNVNAGTANVVIRDNIAGNYEVLGTTTFDIAKASRTISFASIPESLNVEESEEISATPSAGASDGTITYSSSDETKISVDGNEITGVAVGSATITATISEGANYLGASVTSNSIAVSVPAPSHAYVDLGLPSGTLWCTTNIGATNPEDYGLYFAWGETTGYESAAARNQALGIDTGFDEDSYTEVQEDVLPNNKDAAYVNWGNNYKMPSLVQCTELADNCTFTYTQVNGIGGFVVEGTNGNSIFLPFAGIITGNENNSIGEGAYMHTRTGFKVEGVSGDFQLIIVKDEEPSAAAAPNVGYSGCLIRPIYVGNSPTPQPLPTGDIVDLGLPSGNIWASKNLGAQSVTDGGLYYCIGETTGYASVEARNTASGRNDGFTKEAYEALGGTQLEVGTLPLAKDAANAALGGNWCIPTRADLEEIIDNCTRSLIEVNDVVYLKFTATNGNSIVFPFAGYAAEERVVYNKLYAAIATSTIPELGNENEGWRDYVYMDSVIGERDFGEMDIFFGRSIRPVQKIPA